MGRRNPRHNRWLVPSTMAVLLMATGTAGQQMPVPVPVQWALMVKILSFDRNMGSEKVDVGVLFQSELRSSVVTKDELMATMESAAQSVGPRFHCAAIDIGRGHDLVKALNADSLDVLYITPMRAFDLAVITNWARESNIVTLTGIPAFVDRGVSVGIDLQGGKPRIRINLQAARAEGADFDSRLLNLARIVGQVEQ